MADLAASINQYWPIVEFFGAMLAPVIAMAVAWIAWQQYITNRTQLQLARYERQIKIYNAVTSFLGAIIATVDIDISGEAKINFASASSESHFIFDDDEIAEYLRDLWKSWLRLAHARHRILDSNVPDSNKTEDQRIATELHQYFLDQMQTGAREKFRRHLKLT